MLMLWISLVKVQTLAMALLAKVLLKEEFKPLLIWLVAEEEEEEEK
jgi:hypothetical protein